MEFTVDSTGFYIDGQSTSDVEFRYALERCGIRITNEPVTNDLAATRVQLDQARQMYNELWRENEQLKADGHTTPDLLKRICDQARAYGWECGKRMLVGRLLPHTIQSSADNPFVEPDWDDHLKNTNSGFTLSAGDVPL